MQVRLRTNGSNPFPEKIVRERLTQSSAHYGEIVLDIGRFSGSSSEMMGISPPDEVFLQFPTKAPSLRGLSRSDWGSPAQCVLNSVVPAHNSFHRKRSPSLKREALV